MKIYYDLEKEWRCGSNGVRLNGNTPVLRYKEKPVWTFCFLKNGSPCGTADFGGAVSFRAAVDVDLNTETEVICRTTDESIRRTDLSHGELVVPLNANTNGFRSASDGQESRKAFFELWGFDSNTDPVFYVRFEIRISGVVDPEGGVAPESILPDTITRSEVMACLRAPDERQYTSDPSDPSAAHSSQTGSDTHTRRRNSAAAGDWGPWEALIQGPQGAMPVISAGSAVSVPSGESPAVDIVPISGGYQVDFEIPAGAPGQDGQDGADGMDGISPVVSITQLESGVEIYASDAEGNETSGEILNGSLTMPIQPYASDSAYEALTCIAYNGGGYQVISATSAGEDPDNAASKFICFASAGGIPDFQLITSGGSSIVPQVNHVYQVALTSGAVISVNSSGLTSSVCVTQELWIDMPSTAVSFSLPGFTWIDGIVPDFATGNTRYVLTVRWNGTKFLANSAYEESLA